MPPTTAAILAAQRRSHTISSRVWLLADKAPVQLITNILPGGTISLDTTSDNMRQCQFQFVESPIAPLPDWVGKVVPDGVEVKVQQGITTGGDTDWWDVGVFGLQEVDIEHSSAAPGPVWTVTGQDRSYRVTRDPFQTVYKVAAGTAIHTAVYGIMQRQAPWLKRFNLKPTEHTSWAQSWQIGDDPWQACVELAQSAGMAVFFDGSGTLRLIDIPTGKGPTSLAIDTTNALRSVATDIKRVTSNQPGYNGVQVTATNSKGKPLMATAWDSNPASETYYLGPYGKVLAPPVMLSKPMTGAQVVKIAKALLPSILGLNRSLSSTIIHAPWLDAYDLVSVNCPAVKVREVQLVSGFTLPLDYGTLEQLTTVPLGVPPSEYVSAVADLTENLAPTFGVTAP